MSINQLPPATDVTWLEVVFFLRGEWKKGKAQIKERKEIFRELSKDRSLGWMEHVQQETSAFTISIHDQLHRFPEVKKHSSLILKHCMPHIQANNFRVKFLPLQNKKSNILTA